MGSTQTERKTGPHRTIHVRTGTIHIDMLNGDVKHLFKIIYELHNRSTPGKYGKSETYRYQIMYLHQEKDYIIGNLVRIRNLETADTVPMGTNVFEPQTIENKKAGMVRFYIDTDNTIILEENRPITRNMFGKILADMIEDYTLYNEPNYGPLMGKDGFEITFDRYDDTGWRDFMNKVHKLTRVKVVVRVQQNPNRGNSMQMLKKQYEEVNADSLWTCKKGDSINKDADMMEAVKELTDDGHFDTKLNGTDESGEKMEFISNPSKDDLHLVDAEEGNTESFFEKIKDKILPIVKKRLSRGKD